MTLRFYLTDRFTQIVIASYLLLSLMVSLLIWRATGHHFNYSLDDPLIHLAMAQGISQGTYGINPGETASPSSSVLWPFLLVPFMNHSFSVWVPLIFNTVFSIAACILLGLYVRRWYLTRHPDTPAILKVPLAALLVVAANLVGLTYIGMEHVLQIVLVIGCCFSLMEAYYGKPIPRWTLVMAALAPAVRYEDLAFTLAVALVCLAQRRPRAAALTFGLSLLPLLGLGVFLHAHGLSFLPNSVLLKGGGEYTGPHPLLNHLKNSATNLGWYFRNPGRILITLMVLMLGVLAWQKRRDTIRLRILLACLLTCGLMMFIAPYGWFYRYDVCLRVFVFLILFGVLSESKRFTPIAALALTLMASVTYLLPLHDSAEFAREIFLQQRQLARFSHDFYHGNVAVNDIGWVSYMSDRQYYVLDLYGLASPEAMKSVKTTEWMDDITRRHHTALVMVYKEWFPQPPASWHLLGELKLQRRGKRFFVGGDTVTFYATGEADLPLLQSRLADFARTLPPGASMTLASDAVPSEPTPPASWK